MKKIEFQIPKDYVVPEGTQDGATFEESATFQLKGDKLCLTALNGVPMPGYEEKENAAPAAASTPDADLASRYMAAMQQPGAAA